MRMIWKGLAIAAVMAAVAFSAISIGRNSHPVSRHHVSDLVPNYRAVLSQYADRPVIKVCTDFQSQASCYTMTDDLARPAAAQMMESYSPVAVESPKMMSDVANAIVQWMWPIILPIIAGFIVDFLVRVRAWLGEGTTDTQRARLQEMAENGVNLAIHNVAPIVTGKIPAPTKEQIMSEAVDYVQSHGVDTLKALGVDPTDPKTVQGLKARVATILAQREAKVAIPLAPITTSAS